VLSGAVAECTAADEGFKGSKYQRKIETSRAISSATSINTAVSSANESTMNVTASSPPDNHVNNVLNTSTITSLGNSEPAALTLSSNESGTKNKISEYEGEQQPEAVQQSKGNFFHLSEKDFVARKCGRLENTSNASQNSCSDKLAAKIFNVNGRTNGSVTSPLDNSEESFLPDFIAGSHNMNASDLHHADESHSFVFITGSHSMNSSDLHHADESQSFSVFGSDLLHDSEEHDESSLLDWILLPLRSVYMFFNDWIFLPLLGLIILSIGAVIYRFIILNINL